MEFKILNRALSTNLLFEVPRYLEIRLTCIALNPQLEILYKHKKHDQVALEFYITKPKMAEKLKYEVRTFDLDTTLKDALPTLQEVLGKFDIYLINIAAELNLDTEDIILCFSDEPLTHKQLKRLYLMNEI